MGFAQHTELAVESTGKWHMLDAMTTGEEWENARELIAAEQEDDETIRLDVERYAQLVWDEDRAIGRPEMTGQWKVHFRDGTVSEPIDRQKDDVDGAIAAARDIVARKLTNL
ncbi:MAG: hypothetical protein ACRDLM_03205 [Gaiellaceae bacterium]